MLCTSAPYKGPSKQPLSFPYKAFLQPVLPYASPKWFPSLSVTNVTKLEHYDRGPVMLMQAAFQPTLFPFFSEASLPPLQVTDSFYSVLYAGPLSSNLLCHFKIGQTLRETLTYRISWSLCVHSPADAFSLYSQGGYLCLPFLFFMQPTFFKRGAHSSYPMLLVSPSS